jgi:hypothetical protein
MRTPLLTIHRCPLMRANTRRMSWRVVEVEAKSLDASTNGERRQARLFLMERAPTVGERRMYQTRSAYAERQHGLSGNVAQAT